jgi:hypothetical protein
LPDNKAIIEQLTSRQYNFTIDGKLALEDKRIMFEERGIESPDETDALFGAMAAQDMVALGRSYAPVMTHQESEQANELVEIGAWAGM